jgi:hypothetical protein
VLLGELVDTNGVRRDLHLKGSGRTPFARGGDGLAAVGPMLREYVMGEAMHALGIPTTRALAVVATGDQVVREAMLPGAVLARVASSHLRVGTFQYAASLDDPALLRALADHAIARHHPGAAESDHPYLAFFDSVVTAQAELVARWMLVGFIHGVLNTDNVTISGETIDFGPCAFMEAFDPATVFSSIDHAGRYAYGNQPQVTQWNLARLAEAMLPLLDPDTDRAVALATEVLEAFPDRFRTTWTAGMRAKLGRRGPHRRKLGRRGIVRDVPRRARAPVRRAWRRGALRRARRLRVRWLVPNVLRHLIPPPPVSPPPPTTTTFVRRFGWDGSPEVQRKRNRGRMGAMDTTGTTTTTDSTVARGVTPERLDNLRKWNLGLTVLHAVQAVLIVVLSGDFVIQVVSTFPEGEPGTRVPDAEPFFDVRVGFAIGLFLASPRIDHLLTATVARSTYEADLRRGINRFRWVEYSFSATIMVLLIGMYSGITNITAAGRHRRRQRGHDPVRVAAGAHEPAGRYQHHHAAVLVRHDRRHRPVGRHPINIVGADTVPGFVYGIFVVQFVLLLQLRPEPVAAVPGCRQVDRLRLRREGLPGAQPRREVAPGLADLLPEPRQLIVATPTNPFACNFGWPVPPESRRKRSVDRWLPSRDDPRWRPERGAGSTRRRCHRP